jgi:hypothetical protein
LAAEGTYPIWPFGGPTNAGTGTETASGKDQPTSIIPAAHDYDRDFGKDREGGQQ